MELMSKWSTNLSLTKKITSGLWLNGAKWYNNQATALQDLMIDKPFIEEQYERVE